MVQINQKLTKFCFLSLLKLQKESIIGLVEENTYKDIIPSIIENNHTVIVRTPIDISLKELNILLSEASVNPDVFY